MKVFTGKVKETDLGFSTAMFKEEITGEVYLGETGLKGDEQASMRVHGGPERALHYYPAQHYAWWQNLFPERKGLFSPPLFGENVSDVRWDETTVCIGDIFRWGNAVIQVSMPRTPCYKLSKRTGIDNLALLMQQSAKCGWFFRVLQTGTASAASSFELVGHCGTITVREMMYVMFGDGKNRPPKETAVWRKYLETEALSPRWKKTLQKRIDTGLIESWDSRLLGPAA